jgi:predicted proteasome-type protease
MITGQKILVLEKAGNSSGNSDLLKYYGFEIRSTDLSNLFEDAMDFQPNFILVDSTLYSRNGSIYNQLRLNEQTKDIPILLVSKNKKPVMIRSVTTTACYVMMLSELVQLFNDINSNFLTYVN